MSNPNKPDTGLFARLRSSNLPRPSLRQRASEYRRELSSPPRQLRQVIADFEAQIDEINARLHDLAREPASVEFSNERDHITTITDGDTGLLRRLIPPPSKEAT